jgi:hypothetical protein
LRGSRQIITIARDQAAVWLALLGVVIHTASSQATQRKMK